MGVTYGATRHNFLQKKEDSTKDARNKAKAERDAKLAAEKKILVDGNLYKLISHILKTN